MNKITKLEHKIIVNNFGFITADYIVEGNNVKIITRHLKNDDIYRVDTTITISEEEKEIIDGFLSKIEPELMNPDDSQSPVIVQTIITFDCNGEEVSASYNDNQKMNKSFEKAFRFISKKYKKELRNHDERIYSIISGKLDGMDGIVKEEPQITKK